MSADCPLYSQESNKMMDSLTIQQYYSKFGSVLEYIKNYTHLEMDKQSVIYSTQTLYYALLIEVNIKIIATQNIKCHYSRI